MFHMKHWLKSMRCETVSQRILYSGFRLLSVYGILTYTHWIGSNMKWKTVAENTKYEVSDNGDIRNTITRLVLKQSGLRYQQISLTFEGRAQRTFTVHRLVASAFLKNPLNLLEVNHVDGDKRNNSVDNLEWCTRERNMKHAHSTGLIKSTLGHHYNIKYITQVEKKDASIGYVLFGMRDFRKLGLLSGAITNCVNRPSVHKSHRGFRVTAMPLI